MKWDWSKQDKVEAKEKEKYLRERKNYAPQVKMEKQDYKIFKEKKSKNTKRYASPPKFDNSVRAMFKENKKSKSK